jgi:hypothetical protein
MAYILIKPFSRMCDTQFRRQVADIIGDLRFFRTFDYQVK